MAENRPFKFKHKVTASGFSKALSQRIDDYFQERRISKRANPEMIFKTMLGFALWIATYLWLMTGRFSSLEVVGVYVLHGFAQLFMGLNIAHDANHDAYVKSKRLNRVLGCVISLSTFAGPIPRSSPVTFFDSLRMTSEGGFIATSISTRLCCIVCPHSTGSSPKTTAGFFMRTTSATARLSSTPAMN